MIFYKNMKAMACSPNDVTNFFDIVAGVLQFISGISINNMLWLCTTNVNRK